MREGGRRHAPPLVFAGRIDATPQAVSAFLVTLRGDLRARNHPLAAAPSWELVLAELLNNVVEHACDGQPGHGVDFWLRFSAQGVAGRLADRGRPMPGLALPPGREPALGVSTADLPEGGFGWNLIRRLCTRLDYRRTEGENRIDFILPAEDTD